MAKVTAQNSKELGVVRLSNVRISFPHIVAPQLNTNPNNPEGVPTYSASFILEPDHKGWMDFQETMARLAQEKWKDKTSVFLPSLANGDKNKRCFYKGEEKTSQESGLPWEGYEGNMIISANCKNSPPQLFDGKGQMVDGTNPSRYKELAEKMYGGCRVNAIVKPWVQDNTFGKALRCELLALQFLKDDTPFGSSKTDLSDLFAEVEPSVEEMPTAPFETKPAVPSFLNLIK